MKSSSRGIILLALALAMCASPSAEARILPVPLVCQEQSNWCWAGCTQATIDYYEQVSTLQCLIADYACNRHGWCATCNCCENPADPTCCNRGNCMYGAPGCIQDLLSNWGVSSVGSVGALSLATIGSEIDTNCRPFIINWAWTGGGGHYIIGRGIDNSNNIHYMDPWPPGGCAYHIASYSWMVSSSAHTWAYSLKMTTAHYCLGPDLVVCEPQGGTNPSHPPTYWYDVTPTTGGRCDFHVRVYDPDPADYTNWSLPAPTWQFAVHQVGDEWWASWWDPGCTNAIFALFRFQFDNPGGSSWADWRTTISGTSIPTFGIADWADNHADEANGYGYLVHAPDALVATTLYVPSQYSTIQAAINAAQDGDTVMIADGTYTGPGNRGLDFGGKAITVTSSSHDPELCIIDCQDSGRGFYFHSGEGSGSVVEGMTITNGVDSYGGIFCTVSSSPTLTNCILSGNSVYGMFCEQSSSPTITNCTFSGSTNDGMFCRSSASPTVTNCTFSGNGFNGIFMRSWASPTVTYCTFLENGRSGMFFREAGSPTVSNCTFVGNLTNGIYCDMSASPTFENIIIAFGTGGEAVHCDLTSSATLICCDVFGNEGGDWVGCIVDQEGNSGNICSDPVFCSSGSGDFHLQDDSPCAPFTPPNEDCDLIGAWPVGCGPGGVAGYIPNVPDANQPPTSTITPDTTNFCAPMAAVNITEYWDVVQGHPNAVGVNAALGVKTAAEYIGYFMGTNGFGSPARMNTGTPGTYAADEMPGFQEFVRWDAANPFLTPPPTLPTGKSGYTWAFSYLDVYTASTDSAFNFCADEIDAGRPVKIDFLYWNPVPEGIIVTDPESGDPIEFCDWGPWQSGSSHPDHIEEWNEFEGEEGIGHAVTGVGYFRSYDPDGAGPLPLADYIVVHDNWSDTPVNIAIAWANWNAAIAVDPRSVIDITVDLTPYFDWGAISSYPGLIPAGNMGIASPAHGYQGCYFPSDSLAPFTFYPKAWLTPGIHFATKYGPANVRLSDCPVPDSMITVPDRHGDLHLLRVEIPSADLIDEAADENVVRISMGEMTMPIAISDTVETMVFLASCDGCAESPDYPSPSQSLEVRLNYQDGSADSVIFEDIHPAGRLDIDDPTRIFLYGNEVFVCDPAYLDSLAFDPYHSEAWHWYALYPENTKLLGSVAFVGIQTGEHSEIYISALSYRKARRQPQGVDWDADALRGATRLMRSAPNPFGRSTVIRFELARPSEVDLSVYDVSGRRLRILASGSRVAGQHVLTWNGRDDGKRSLASGIYFLRLAAGEVHQTRRLVLLR
ncbi:MAG: right-handed parallel beta-helix repeat-containing protein [Candidatus Eisenbacteria sp.]|nr:right-handed parallel beta-helix repeat-containing protein [Candidatus Eisenbacteria bacterium]